MMPNAKKKIYINQWYENGKLQYTHFMLFSIENKHVNNILYLFM